MHDFYVAVENMLQAIARDIDEKLPSGQSWHHALLFQMTMKIPEVRPAVLTKKTAAGLDEYRAFRHVFRNVYGFNLNAERLEGLLQKLPRVMNDLRTDMEAFIEKLMISMQDMS